MNKDFDQNFKRYQKIIKINELIEKGGFWKKYIIWLMKIFTWRMLHLKRIKKDKRDELIIALLKFLEYELRKECGYALTEEQEKYCLKYKLWCYCYPFAKIVDIKIIDGEKEFEEI